MAPKRKAEAAADGDQQNPPKKTKKERDAEAAEAASQQLGQQQAHALAEGKALAHSSYIGTFRCTYKQAKLRASPEAHPSGPEYGYRGANPAQVELLERLYKQGQFSLAAFPLTLVVFPKATNEDITRLRSLFSKRPTAAGSLLPELPKKDWGQVLDGGARREALLRIAENVEEDVELIVHLHDRTPMLSKNYSGFFYLALHSEVPTPRAPPSDGDLFLMWNDIVLSRRDPVTKEVVTANAEHPERAALMELVGHEKECRKLAQDKNLLQALVLALEIPAFNKKFSFSGSSKTLTTNSANTFWATQLVAFRDDLARTPRRGRYMAAFDLKTLQLLAPKGQKRLAYPFALAPPTINEDDGSIVEEDWELDDAEVYRDRVASRCQDVFELLTKLQKEKDTADRATRLLEELQARTKLARHKDAMPEDEDEYESWDDPSKDGGDGHWWPEFWSPLDLTSTSEMGKAVAILSSTVLMPLTKALFVTTQAGVVAPKRSEQFGLAHALQHARQKPQLIRAIDLSPLLHYTMAYRNEILASLNLLLLARTPHSLRIIPKHEEQKFTRNQLHRSYKFLHPILDFINLPHLVPFGDYAQATLEPTPDQVEGAQATMESYKLNPNTVPANVTIPSAAPPTPPPAQQPKGSPPEKRKKGGSNGQEDDSEEEEEESRSGDTDDDERPIPGGLDGKGKEKRNFHASDSQDKENHPHSDQRQANATAKLHELERRLAELQRTHDDLRHSTDELAETKEQLAGDVDSLRGTKETLEDEVGELREVKEALETEVYDLEQKKRDYAAGYE